MAINKKLIHFKALDLFKNSLNSGQILNTSIVFVQDAKLIWKHGQYYGSTDEIQSRFNDLIDTVSENELVTASASSDYTHNVIPEGIVDSEFLGITSNSN